jgi:transcriptional regulator with PAS, ATPase and Fis domain
MMERAVLLARTSELTSAEFNLPSNVSSAITTENQSLPMITLDDAEQQLIRQALAQANNNKQQAADLLGITKSSLYRRLEKYGFISPGDN